ncbi:MAG: class F sortase [Candidatus Peribacter sp.]|nr:class F sortase [Candidatus Peribacter sp.]
MYNKTIFRAAMLVGASTGCALLLLMIGLAPRLDMQAALQRPMRGTSFLRQPQADAGLPVRLRIPSIKVDAAIESVGLTSKGAMDVPKDPDNVGWYSLGSKPGEKGSAVFAGHLDWYKGKKAVFQQLNKLRKGDLLSVENDKGKFLTFIVRDIRTYEPNEYAPDVFLKNDVSHLNLVTCGGVWDTARKIYRERLVVFTDLVEKM